MANDQRKYYESLSTWPEVDVFDKTVDGLVPASRIENWQDFDRVVNRFVSDDSIEDFVFRAQHHYIWNLESTLDRFAKPAIDKKAANRHLNSFRLAIRGRVPDNSILDFHEDPDDAEDLELWAVGQHHGLATPLLDWTRSPYVALFFAFEKMDSPEWGSGGQSTPFAHSRAIYVLNERFIADLDFDPDYPRVIEPSKDDHGRLVNQAGLFTYTPYGETLESSLIRALTDSGVNVDNPEELGKYLQKIHIPNVEAERQRCLQRLRKMNIHHGSLFPDLIGAAGYCNELTREIMSRAARPAAVSAALSDKVTLKDHADAVVVSATLTAAILQALRERSSGPGGPDEKQLNGIAKAIAGFIDKSAGVDWYVRESQLARLRTFTRRQLIKINYDENIIHEAAAAAVAAAAEHAKMNPAQTQ